MYFVRSPFYFKWLFPSLIWRIGVTDKSVFLTFDDGPDPEVTPQVLDILKEKNALATFFCVGQKVAANPELFRRITDEGHSIGNHSNRHLKGQKTSTENYVRDTLDADSLIHSSLFRPPYGQITRAQTNILKRDFKIIMWSLLAGDFDENIQSEVILERLIKHTRPGDIIVLHDNSKFKDKVLHVLGPFIDHFTKRGFLFKPIDYKRVSQLLN